MTGASANRVAAERRAKLRNTRALAIGRVSDAVDALLNEDKHTAAIYIEAAQQCLDELARAAWPDGED